MYVLYIHWNLNGNNCLFISIIGTTELRTDKGNHFFLNLGEPNDRKLCTNSYLLRINCYTIICCKLLVYCEHFNFQGNQQVCICKRIFLPFSVKLYSVLSFLFFNLINFITAFIAHYSPDVKFLNVVLFCFSSSNITNFFFRLIKTSTLLEIASSESWKTENL